MQFNRLAVLICGEYRTWPRVADYMFDYFEQLANQVDYYFVTWNRTRDFWWPEEESILTERSVTDIDITQKFQGRNLISYRLIDTQELPRYDLSFYYLAYLALQANKLKTAHETNAGFVYDQVFETRPDIYIRFNPGNPVLTPCGDNDYAVFGQPWVDRSLGVDLVHLNDFMCRTNSAGNNVLSQRFYFKNSVDHRARNNNGPTNNHGLLYEFLTTSGMQHIGDNWCDAEPVRVNFPEDFYRYSFEELRKMNREFTKY